ncbi:MAG: fluoride efflux transporter CrcB [Acidobacteria bacterium]|nr:fluoride efflux transporter CrcB [Acidobacteriota bacterium]
MRYLWIALAGGAGSVCRYLVWRAMSGIDGSLPFGTLAVNLAGCFGIGLAARVIQDELIRLALVTGFLGGFTTFSAFGLETLNLLRAGAAGTAVVYVVVSNAGGLAAAWAGWRVASR